MCVCGFVCDLHCNGDLSVAALKKTWLKNFLLSSFLFYFNYCFFFFFLIQYTMTVSVCVLLCVQAQNGTWSEWR